MRVPFLEIILPKVFDSYIFCAVFDLYIFCAVFDLYIFCAVFWKCYVPKIVI